MKLLVTDLDNTIYDWVTFFAKSFKAMVDELSILLCVEESVLLSEFKIIHQKYHNTEQPFAVLELPSVQAHFKNASRAEILEKLNKPLHAFNSTRKRHLLLYQGVEDTFKLLKDRGYKIIAYTEASVVNSYFRLQKLSITNYIDKLYASEGNVNPHPLSERQSELMPPDDYITKIPNHHKKPNPQVLLDICRNECEILNDMWYIGDSLTKDVAMANEAGVKSIWAKYGTEYDRSLWSILVSVTHWTDQDVKREEEIKNKFKEVTPNYTISSFAELANILL